jgi:hypothetical protein
LNLSGTGVNLKSRHEDAMQNYRAAFNEFIEKKQKESGGFGGIRISVDSNRGFSFSSPREKEALNLTGLPKFTPPQHTFAEALAPALVDFGLLGLYTLAAFAAAFVRFLKYDVR